MVRRISVAMALIAGCGLSLVSPAGAQRNADVLAEKELEIRNLRRRIFDLESQVPTDDRQDRLRAEIERLKADGRKDRSALESDYAQRIEGLNERIRELQRELNELRQAAGDQDKSAKKEIDSRDRQLLRSNEMLTKAMAERAALQERFDKLQKERDALAAEQVKLTEEAADLRKNRKRLVEKTEKPLLDRISRLEKEQQAQLAAAEEQVKRLRDDHAQQEKKSTSERDDLREQVRQLAAAAEADARRLKEIEKKNGDDLQQSRSTIADLQDKLRKQELELKQTAAAVAELEQERTEWVRTHKDLKSSLDKAAKLRDAAVEEERQKQADRRKEWEKKAEALETQLSGLQQQLRKQEAEYEKNQTQWKRDLENKEALLSDVEARIAETTRPVREELKAKENALEKQRAQLAAEREKQELLTGQLRDKDDKIAVYQKLVDKQETDLKDLRQQLASGNKDLERTLQAERAPLEARIEAMNKELTSANKQLQLQRTDADKEFADRTQKLREEISSLKIDLEYQTNKNTKLTEGKSQIEDTLIALQKKNEMLQKTVTELNGRISQVDEDGLAVRKIREQNRELEERLEILLQENADYQQKVLELTESVKGITNAEEMARELAEAHGLIMGFKKDVDAKTIEISGLVSENQDLRKRLRQYIKDTEDLSNTVKSLKTEKLSRISDEELGVLQEQVNSLRSALSKARQLIAQKDVALEDIQADRDLLRADVTRLSDELNKQIKSVGELEYAKRNNFGGYSDEELQAAKKPLLLEISVLKQRVTDLERQLLETWNRAEGMLLELKNHPQIKQADSGMSLDDVLPRR
ncbi:MAG: hypothetical protein KC897_02685 [Candidatus Omnitrophica bacterium]|nr:hypothetical protein [Candidatus Omnitrophota bacterium]MCB9722172.1 hypothetical protein [Candidatus Omnitrophota bacterium]